jgi:HAD superfamily hydrolase (TIGR02253 family)
MIKAIMFDLDNTLIDFMSLKRVCCESAIDAMIAEGLKLSKKQALDTLYTIYRKEGLEDALIFQKFLKQVDKNIDYRVLAAGIVAYRQARSNFIRPYPKTRTVLANLKAQGIKLAIVSDAPKLKAWIRLAAIDISPFFDVVVALEDTGRTKPSAFPFRAALKQLKVNPRECMMVGDRPDRDIKGAKKIGIMTCFAKYGYEGYGHTKADFTIDKIQDLIPIVQSLKHKNSR